MATTKSHRQGSSNNRKVLLTVLEAGSPSSRCWPIPFWWEPSFWLMEGPRLTVCMRSFLGVCIWRKGEGVREGRRDRERERTRGEREHAKNTPFRFYDTSVFFN